MFSVQESTLQDDELHDNQLQDDAAHRVEKKQNKNKKQKTKKRKEKRGSMHLVGFSIHENRKTMSLKENPSLPYLPLKRCPPCLFFCTVEAPDDRQENDSTHLYHQSYPVYLSAFALSSSRPIPWPRQLQVLD